MLVISAYILSSSDGFMDCLLFTALCLTKGKKHTLDNLLADKVTDLNLEKTSLGIFLDVNVDGKMGVDISHLVLVALGDSYYEVVDDGSDRPQSGNALPRSMVEFDVDGVLLGLFESNSNVTLSRESVSIISRRSARFAIPNPSPVYP